MVITLGLVSKRYKVVGNKNLPGQQEDNQIYNNAWLENDESKDTV